MSSDDCQELFREAIAAGNSVEVATILRNNCDAAPDGRSDRMGALCRLRGANASLGRLMVGAGLDMRAAGELLASAVDGTERVTLAGEERIRARLKTYIDHASLEALADRLWGEDK